MCIIQKSANPTGVGVWWQDDTKWCQYTQHHDNLIRKGVHDKLTTIDLGVITSGVHPQGQRYVVDLDKMEQVAVRTGQRRPVMIIDAAPAPRSQLQISGPPQLEVFESSIKLVGLKPLRLLSGEVRLRGVHHLRLLDYEAFTTFVFVAQAFDAGLSRSSGVVKVHYRDNNGQLKEYDVDVASALLRNALGQQRSVVLPGNTGQLMLFNFETMEQCFVDGFCGSTGEAILADRAPVKFFIEVPWNLERMMNLVRVAESTTRRKIFGMTIEKLRNEEYLTLTLPEMAHPRTIVATEVEYQPRVGEPRFEEFVSALEQNLLACPKLIESFLKLTVPGSSEDSKVQIVFKPFGKKRNESLREKRSQVAFWMSMAAPIAAAHAVVYGETILKITAYLAILPDVSVTRATRGTRSYHSEAEVLIDRPDHYLPLGQLQVR
ncbi:hypothetical protein R1sor_007476 [Riccia sorocarpa]|uniref:WWE domain-containing protein n=1 Tax=Riccia sorocarpa TaxID=122646 RepID=A0ABD3HQK6_9MARC